MQSQYMTYKIIIPTDNVSDIAKRTIILNKFIRNQILNEGRYNSYDKAKEILLSHA